MISGTFSFSDIIDDKLKLKDGTYLYIDAIYQSRQPRKNLQDDVLPKLMSVGTQGGFRYKGTVKPFNVKKLVLYTTNEDDQWIDCLYPDTGIFTYYGDNKQPGKPLHDTKLHGNEILKNIFTLDLSRQKNERMKVPPIFIFEKSGKCDYCFRGLAIPGNKNVSEKDWLLASWARDGKKRFQNYKAVFTILDISKGSDIEPGKDSINLNWIKDIDEGNAYESQYAPKAWKAWVDTGDAAALMAPNAKRRIRKKEQQLPKANSLQESMLKTICQYFKDDFFSFEKFAIFVARLQDDHILELIHTRPRKDGGRDGIGTYRIGKGDISIDVSFALEAKCYDFQKSSVGVKETSRLISRIKQREFGVLVTTSYVSQQAYEEILEDKHPIIIISGVDIVNILLENNYKNTQELHSLLANY